MFREIVHIKKREKFALRNKKSSQCTKNGERDYVAPINIARDRCKSLQTARDRVMSLTFHLIMHSSKSIHFILLIYLAYYFEDIG